MVATATSYIFGAQNLSASEKPNILIIIHLLHIMSLIMLKFLKSFERHPQSSSDRQSYGINQGDV